MGTRSTIHIRDRYGRHLVSIYTQYDGYYEGVGKEIYEFFKDKKNYGNGFEDTALLFVANYKGNKSYNKYLTRESDRQEYNYFIQEGKEGILFSISKEVYVEQYENFALIDTLMGGNLEEFVEELNTEISEERKIKFGEEIKDEQNSNN